jgi:AcrR family transcriptional regulator
MSVNIGTNEAAITNGEHAFLTPATIRQPAEGLGVRAQRTIGRIVEAAREVFMTRGYSGTTIDEIARIADVSRASFYTYFPSKREVLLAVGAHAASGGSAIIGTLAGRAPTIDDMTTFVTDYFGFLDTHGSFTFAWTQAAQEDEEIRVAGMKRHLGMCKSFGTRLAAMTGRSVPEPALLGLLAASLLERSWGYTQLYADRINRSAVVDQAARALIAIAAG